MNTKFRDHLVNVPEVGQDGSRKAFCPLCLYDILEIPMVFDEKNDIWKCNKCGYFMRKHMNPVEDTVLTAGNQEVLSKPYGKIINLPSRRPSTTSKGIYHTPTEAWNDAAD